VPREGFEFKESFFFLTKFPVISREAETEFLFGHGAFSFPKKKGHPRSLRFSDLSAICHRFLSKLTYAKLTVIYRKAVLCVNCFLGRSGLSFAKKALI
jgi:hypothetical protein